MEALEEPEVTERKKALLFTWRNPLIRILVIACLCFTLLLCLFAFYWGPSLREELQKKEASVIEIAKENGCEALFIEEKYWREIEYKVVFCEDGRIGFFTRGNEGKFTER